MKLTTITTLLLATLAYTCAPASAQAQSTDATTAPMAMPEMPAPQKEHEWLKQLEGEWDTEIKISMPGMDSMNSSGSESIKSIGGFWVVSETRGNFMGQPFTGNLILGYSPEKSKYIGTWVDSSGSRLWIYEGTVDSSGKTLTLNTEGPCPMQGGKMAKMQETIEIQSPDVKIFTSRVDFDGKWVTGMTMTSTRKK